MNTIIGNDHPHVAAPDEIVIARDADDPELVVVYSAEHGSLAFVDTEAGQVVERRVKVRDRVHADEIAAQFVDPQDPHVFTDFESVFPYPKGGEDVTMLTQADVDSSLQAVEDAVQSGAKLVVVDSIVNPEPKNPMDDAVKELIE